MAKFLAVLSFLSAGILLIMMQLSPGEYDCSPCSSHRDCRGKFKCRLFKDGKKRCTAGEFHASCFSNGQSTNVYSRSSTPRGRMLHLGFVFCLGIGILTLAFLQTKHQFRHGR